MSDEPPNERSQSIRALALMKNTVVLGLGTFLPKVASFVILPILTGCLTKTEYGIYDLVITMVSLLLPAVTLQSPPWQDEIKYGFALAIRPKRNNDMHPLDRSGTRTQRRSRFPQDMYASRSGPQAIRERRCSFLPLDHRTGLWPNGRKPSIKCARARRACDRYASHPRSSRSAPPGARRSRCTRTGSPRTGASPACARRPCGRRR